MRGTMGFALCGAKEARKKMRSLEEIDPGLLDQAICRLLAQSRPPHREAAIIAHLSESSELQEWVKMMTKFSVPSVPIEARIYTAVSIGLEVGYHLGEHEARRAQVVPTETLRLLEAARHCLKSYEYHNSATEPARDMAERIEQVLKKNGVEVNF
jgi:hypothetical protein